MHEAIKQQTDWRSELFAMTRLAIPVVLSELGWMLQGVVDIYMVGQLGSVALGAVALGNALYYTPSLFGIGILLGLDTVISQAYGRKDYDDCHRWLAQGIYLLLGLTLPLMLLVWAGTFFFGAIGIEPALTGPAAAYIRVVNLGTLPLLIYAASRRYLQAVGEVRVIAITYIAANLLNWFGNWVLIYGKLGMPALGVRGSAISTVLSRVLMACSLMFAAWRYERRRGHPLFAHWARPQIDRLKALLRLGLPAAGQMVLEVGAFGAATLLAGRLSPEALAGHQIALNYAAMTYMVPLGISAAASVSVGHAIGAGDPFRARRSGWLAMALGCGFMVLAAIVFFLLPQQLTSFFSTDPKVLAIAPSLLGIAAAFQVFDAIQTISNGSLRGLGETRIPFLVNLVGYWVLGLPLGAFLCFGLGWGLNGLWLGLTLSLILIAMALLWRWNSDSLRLIRTETP